MRRIGFAIAVGALLAGTSAFAQGGQVNVSGTSADTIVLPSGCSSSCDVSIPPTSLGYGKGSETFPSSTYPSNATGRAQWNSFVTDNSDTNGTITFLSANDVSGQPIGAGSTSSVTLNVTNGYGLNLHSTITPAGMGFYVANVGDGSCILTGSCAQVAANSSYSFADFAAIPGFSAHTEFDFSIVAQQFDFTTSLYHMSGNLDLGIGATGGLSVSDFYGDNFSTLSHFGLETPVAGGDVPYHSLGYNWLETEISGLGPINIESTYQVIYSASVLSSVNAPCLSGRDGVDQDVTACLIAYSGFGDPIGRGVATLSIASAGDIQVLNHGEDDLITGLNFTPFTIDVPRIAGNTLVIGGTVPEPATWAMMILGFASIGGVLRRRRDPAHA
jgi:hypothetical protein